MRDTASSFSSLLGDRPSLRRRSHHASADATPIETPGPSYLTPLPDIPADCPRYLAANETGDLLKQRLVDLGFIAGTPLRLVRRGPKGNLIAVRVRDTVIALRSNEARSLLVAPDPMPLPVSDE
jgi:ferrous iron transport protein A